MVKERIVKDYISRIEFSIAVAEDTDFEAVNIIPIIIPIQDRDFILATMNNYEKVQKILAELWNKARDKR